MKHPASPDYHRTLFNSVRQDPLTMLSAAATAVSALGSIASGNAARGQANYQARQMEQQAGQERATAQRAAIEQRHKAALAGSRAQALAAASGGGASDPTIVGIQSDIAGQGEYNALSALFNGEERARGMETQAQATRFQGQQARKAGVMGAFTSVANGAGTIMGSGNSLLNKYGGGPEELPWMTGARQGRLAPNAYSSYG